MLELRNISKIYQTKTRRVAALDGVSFSLPEKGSVFILGRSGSGKSTMLNMLGGLDAPTEGELLVDGVSSRDFKQADFDNYRNRYVGFVFQEYHLLDDYTVADNIALALELQGDLTQEERQRKIAAALSQVDLAGYGDRNTGELSGGQKQRVAIARALVKNPPMILADEPTGALDRKTGRQLFDLLKEISKDKLVVVVSHDEDFAHEYADRIIELDAGRIVSDSNAEEPQPDTKQGNLRPGLKQTGLSAKNILRLGKNNMQRKKLRLAFTAVLCAVSFLLVSAADLLSAYEYRTVLASSLYDQRPSYITLSKEMYNDYDYSKSGLMLPTQEAVDWFRLSGIRESGGTPSWQTEYMFTDEDLADLHDRTGLSFKGVYTLPLENDFVNMNIEQNFLLSETYFTAEAYADEFFGFVEFTQQDLQAFGYTLTAGRLPRGDADELAISQYLYECFLSVGYRDYRGRTVLIEYIDKQTGKIIHQTKIPWNEFLDDEPYLKEVMKTPAELEADWGFPVSCRLATSGYDGEASKVKAPEDLLGKTLFVAGRAYTITGIIDTGFDATQYDSSYYDTSISEQDAQELLQTNEAWQEYQRGVACLAFVGEGKVQQIAAQHPTVVFMDSFEVVLRQEPTALKITGFVRAAEMTDAFSVDEEVTDSQFFVFHQYETIYDLYLHGKQTHTDYFGQMTSAEMQATGKNGRSDYSKSNCSLETFRVSNASTGYPILYISMQNCALPDEHLYKIGGSGRYDIYNIPCYAAVSDHIFDLFTEGRAGTYTYAIGPLPQAKSEIQAAVNGCLAEQDGVRYHIGGVIAGQLDRTHEFLSTLGDMCKYLSSLIVIFAAAVFAMFTILSIREKKQQIGIMRAMGAGSRDVFAIFFTEGLLVAAVSAVLATALTAVTAIVGSVLLRNLFDLRLTLLNFSVRQAVMIFALSFGIAIVASVIPILRIAKQKPVDAIRKN